MRDDFEYFVSIEENRAKVKIQRSLFISSASYVKDEDEAKKFIFKVSSEFKDATHNCWAYKLGDLHSYSDDGEPSNSAGRPILDAIRSSNFENIAIVVTRYFGGKKLGIRGLIEAYGYSAKLVLESAKKCKFIKGKMIEIGCDYKQFDARKYFIEKHGYIFSQEFREKITIKAFVPINLRIDFEYLDLGKKVIREDELI